MHPIKELNKQVQDLVNQSAAQCVPLNLQTTLLLLVEHADAVTALLDAHGLLPDPAPVNPAPAQGA